MGQCDIFHGPVILPYISVIIKYEGIILWILVQCGTVNDIILYIDHCDLYFMVQWFCLVSLTLSYRKTSDVKHIFSLTLSMTL